MKKSLRFVVAVGTCAITMFDFASCQSTNQTRPNKEIVKEIQRTEKTERTIPRNQKNQPIQVEEPVNTEKAQFENMKITVLSAPNETIKGKAFSAPYKIAVTTLDGNPCSSVNITAEFPSSRTADSISFDRETLTTDENGHATFTPAAPQFSVKSQVSFYPQATSANPQIVKLCASITATSPWNVRTNATSRTGILVSIVDYTQSGKIGNIGGAQLSTQALEKVLWRSGLMGAQNADFHNSIDADDPARIKADALRLIRGNSSFVYVIYGRVKYATQITQDDDGFYNATFNGDMGILNINTGEVLMKTKKTVSVKDKNQWKLITLAQDEMAKLFGEEVIYGL